MTEFRALTIAGATTLRSELAEITSQSGDVSLDLSGVQECDAAGLQLICSLRRTTLDRNGRFEIVTVSPAVENLAEALGIKIQHDVSGRSAGGS